ncbi:hypothetical protein GCM10023189_01370 [Nibrella saemangeumensis]|uniref:histidine kinase n=1 Tax=Nibrella saemangeumensis TaxID=1084526 RepID=A0ABP8MAK0_9BACT
MRTTVKTKIWITVLTVVLLFTSFILFYVPMVQGRYLLNNFNKEVQNFAHTVALGVRIAMTEQNFEGVQMAMDFVRDDPQLRYISLLQVDTVWNANHAAFKLNRTIFKSFPDKAAVDVRAVSNDSTVVKRSAFATPAMNGEILLAFATDEIVQAKKQIRLASLFFSALVLGIGGAIGLWLARNISVPVLALRNAAYKVGEGDLTQRVETRTNDEIAELGTAFNKMVDDLAVARREVDERTKELLIEKQKTEELLVDLQKTLADLKETQEQLIRQEKLASIGQLTKGIVDRMLNPLNYINNFSQLAVDLLREVKDVLEQEKDHFTEDTYADVTDLLQLIEANLTKVGEHGGSASRIVKGMEKLLKERSSEFIPTDINALIENSLNMALQEARAEYKGLTIKVITDFDNTDQQVSVLPYEIRSVIMNLVNNAVYSIYEKSLRVNAYTPELFIKTRFSSEGLEVRVKDNGKGISETEVKQLFSPFFTTKPTAKGTGLGLFLSQDIIKMHRGNITVDTQEGEYTEFNIMLPLNA